MVLPQQALKRLFPNDGQTDRVAMRNMADLTSLPIWGVYLQSLICQL
jgi:hypothetical protein